MKTIREFLEELPEPYRSQALENCKNGDLASHSLSRAIEDAFVWKNTPQGDRYWNRVCCKIELGTL